MTTDYRLLFAKKRFTAACIAALSGKPDAQDRAAAALAEINEARKEQEAGPRPKPYGWHGWRLC